MASRKFENFVVTFDNLVCEKATEVGGCSTHMSNNCCYRMNTQIGDIICYYYYGYYYIDMNRYGDLSMLVWVYEFRVCVCVCAAIGRGRGDRHQHSLIYNDNNIIMAKLVNMECY